MDKLYLHQHAKCERGGSTSFDNMKGGHIAIITTQGGENNVMQRIKYLNHITIIAMWREVMPIVQRETTTTKTWKEATIATQREITLAWKTTT